MSNQYDDNGVAATLVWGFLSIVAIWLLALVYDAWWGNPPQTREASPVYCYVQDAETGELEDIPCDIIWK